MSEVRTSPQALLALPGAGALGPGLRAMLEQHADGPDVAVGLEEPLPVLADTLGALAQLEADPDMVGAAVLLAVREWAAPLVPQIRKLARQLSLCP